MRNDLGEVAIQRLPELAGLLDDLREAGARTQGVSGSGPTLFGLFATREAAAKRACACARTFQGWLAVARGLTGREPEIRGRIDVWTI